MARVLIIDDDSSLTDILSERLKAEGYETDTARNGKDGLRQIVDFHPNVIILDEKMPVMNGTEFMEAIQKESWHNNAHIIVFTAANDVKLLNQKLEKGVPFYLDKGTADQDDIVDAIKHALEL